MIVLSMQYVASRLNLKPVLKSFLLTHSTTPQNTYLLQHTPISFSPVK